MSPRSQHVAWNLPPEPEEVARSRETQPIEFLASAALAFPGVAFAGFPLSELAIGVLVAWAVFHRSRWVVPLSLSAGVATLVGVFLTSALVTDVYDVRRLLHLGLYCLLIMMFAGGRVHMLSVARGLAVGLIASITLSAIELGPAAFSGRLSGFLGDPNAGGYYMLALGGVALSQLTHARFRRLLMLAIVVGVVLTLSRTSLLAMVFAVVWLLIASRLGRVLTLGLVLGLLWVIDNIPEDLKLAGPFRDRQGSDLLRQRIEDQERIQVASAGAFGHGPGTAHVEVQGQFFFYHSSYLAMHAEFGLIGLVVIVALLLITLYRMLGVDLADRSLWLEIALIVTAVCAVNLGEVLLELPTAVVIGAAVGHLGSTRAERENDP